MELEALELPSLRGWCRDSDCPYLLVEKADEIPLSLMNDKKLMEDHMRINQVETDNDCNQISSKTSSIITEDSA